MKKRMTLGSIVAGLILGFVLAGCGDGGGGVNGVTVLPAPENLTTISKDAHSITIGWDAVPDAVSYYVYPDDRASVSVTEPSFTDSGLLAGSPHAYKVVAVDTNVQEGTPSSIAVVTDPPPNFESATDEDIKGLEISDYETKDDLDAALTIPPLEEGTQASAPTYDSVLIEWPPSAFDASAAGVSLFYNIYRKEGSGEPVIIASVPGNGETTYKDTVESGKTYTYEVRPYVVKEDSEGNITAEYETSGLTLPEVETPEEPKAAEETVAEYIKEGSEYLTALRFDNALVSYERAYEIDSADPGAIVYSSLAKLASIARDQKVQSLLKDRFGIRNYPGTIDALLSDTWLTEYVQEEFVPSYYDADAQSRVSWHGEWPQTGGFGVSGSGSAADPDSPNWVLDESDYEEHGPGYYREEFVGNSYVWVPNAPRYNYDWPISDYYDAELGKQVAWYDNGETEGGPGYYYYADDGALTFVSSERKYIIEPYFDYGLNVYLNWYEAGSSPDGGETTIAQTGYHYERSEHKLVFVSNTPNYENRGYSLFPALDVPQWVSANGDYDASFSSGNLPSVATMQLLLFANLVDKNNNGLNNLLDQTLEAVFGETFEAAAARVATLTYDQEVPLNAAIIDKFGLAEIFEGDIVVTKVEMELLIASLRLVKAALEWVDAYDWNTDLNFLKVNLLWTDNDAAEAAYGDLLAKIRTTTLPLQNNFLKDRNNGKMTAAKDDFIKAIDAAIGAYDNLDKEGLIPPGVKDEITGRQWIRAGLAALKDAINNGQTFWIPDSEPVGSSWAYSEANSFIGVNLGNLFAPGHLSLDKIIANTGGVPEFYGFSEDEPVLISAKTDIAKYEAIGFKLNTAPLYGSTGVVAAIDGEEAPSAELTLAFPADVAEALWDAYHK